MYSYAQLLTAKAGDLVRAYGQAYAFHLMDANTAKQSGIDGWEGTWWAMVNMIACELEERGYRLTLCEDSAWEWVEPR